MKNNSNIDTEEKLIAAISASIAGTQKEESQLSSNSDDYEENFVTEEEIARGNGYWVDEDGDWQEPEEDW